MANYNNIFYNKTGIKQLNQGSYLYVHDCKNKPFKLVNNNYLNKLELAFEAYGKLNKEKDNIILIHHSLSMSAHVTDYYNTGIPGWWDNMIGDRLPLDTEKYFIICINNLGSCFGSTGPNNYANFPQITLHDIVKSQKILLDYLEINKLKLVIGSSIGGMLSLAWLQNYPEALEKLFVVACSAKSYPVNLYNRMMQQEIITSLKSNNPKLGLKLARMIGHYYYRNPEELNTRFYQDNKQLYNIFKSYSELNYEKNINQDNYTNPSLYKNTELYNYFDYNSDKFVDVFDVDSYLCLLNALDLYDLTLEKSYHSSGFQQAYLKNNNIDITVAGINTDMLFPLYQQEDVNNLLTTAGYKTNFIVHNSTYGHDAFLTEHEPFGKYISDILSK